MKKGVKNKFLLRVLLLNSLIFIILTLLAVTNSSLITKSDLIINNKILTLNSPSLNYISYLLDIIFKIPAILLLSAVICLIFLALKRKEEARKLAIIMLTSGILIETFKLLISKARPINILSETNGAFPSGHTTIATVFLIYFLVHYIKEIKIKKPLNNKDKSKIVFLSVMTSLLIMIVGFSRLYLNVHWFSDVLGGFTLGFSIVAFYLLIEK